MNASEVRRTAQVISDKTTLFYLSVGVLVSSKTLQGFSNKFPGRYPKTEKIAYIFVSNPVTWNLIHYSTDTPETLASDLKQLTSLGGVFLDGFQLNIAWPSLVQLEKYHHDIDKDTFIVLQIGRGAMAAVDESPDKLADKLKDYVGIVNAILIDPSGGRNEPFDLNKTTNYLREIESREYGIYLGVAGGLRPDNIERLAPLIREFPNLNIDAEGGLRTPMPEDMLDLNIASQYLARAISLFDTAPNSKS